MRFRCIACTWCWREIFKRIASFYLCRCTLGRSCDRSHCSVYIPKTLETRFQDDDLFLCIAGTSQYRRHYTDCTYYSYKYLLSRIRCEIIEPCFKVEGGTLTILILSKTCAVPPNEKYGARRSFIAARPSTVS